MISYNKLLAVLAFAAISANTFAQTTVTNSSYSRFGLGELNDQSQGFNKNMGGVGIGLRAGNIVNMSNPASYSAIDSVSFIFDVGMNAKYSTQKSKSLRDNNTSCNLDYVNAGLRLYKNVGLSFGFVPLTSVGYSFSNTSRVGKDLNSLLPITKQNAYDGNGGLHQAYVGVGAKVFKTLSVGANVSFIWGSLTNSVKESFSEGGSSSTGYGGLNSTHETFIKTYKIDLGVQYPVRLSNIDWLTVGATAGLGHTINGEATLKRYTGTDTNPQEKTAKDAFDLPYTYGLGLGWQHEDRLMVGADFRHELWANCHTPSYNSQTGEYIAATGQYRDRIKVAAGAQYVIDPYNRKFWKRIRYRIGAHAANSNLKINGQNGPREYGLSIGAGLPIFNQFTTRSVVNVGLQWTRLAPRTTNMITEDNFMVNVGLTFNDRWFMKFRIN